MKRLLNLLRTLRDCFAAEQPPAEPRLGPREWADLPTYPPANP